MNKKALLISSLVLLSSVTMTGLSACGGEEGSIRLNGTVLDKYEYTGKAIYFPSAAVVNSNGELLSYDVNYSVYDVTNKKTVAKGEYSSFPLDVGSYEIIYSYNSKSIRKPFQIVDTTNPVITFSGVPSSLYLQDIENKDRIRLPSYSVSDLSMVEKDSKEETLLFNGKQIEVDDFFHSYAVNTFGELEYTVSVSDVHGNKSTNTATWKIKDKDYQPSSIQNGLLMDFSEYGYTNLVSESTNNEFYNVKSFEDNYLSSYKEVEGVVSVKLGFRYNSYTGKNSSITLNLPEASYFTYDDLKDKYLAVRLMIENNEGTNLNPKVKFLGNVTESDGSGMKCLELSKSVTIGEWKTIYIDGKTAARMGLFPNSTHENGSDATFPGGDKLYFNTVSGTCKSLSFGFSDNSSDHLSSTFNVYFDSIAIADKVLDEPRLSFDKSTNTLSWNNVSGASKYSLNINGTIIETQSTRLTIPSNEKGFVKVSAIHDHITVIDSSEALQLYGLNDDGVIYLNDDLYKNLVYPELTFNRNDQFENQNYSYKKGSFIVTDEGLKCTLSSSPWGVVNGISLRLPSVIHPGDCDMLTIRMKLSSGAYSNLNVYDDGGLGKGYPLVSKNISALANEFFDLTMDLKSLDHSISRLDFIFGIGSSLSSFEITFASIGQTITLASPNVTISNDTFSWKPVEHATDYEIYIDGKLKDTIQNTSYNHSSKEEIRIVAVSDNSNYSASVPVCYVNDNGWKKAILVDSSSPVGGYSTESLIQMTNILLDIPSSYGEVTSFDVTHLNCSLLRDDVTSPASLESLHYHANLSSPIFQPHISGLQEGDVFVISRSGSFFSLAEMNRYYILSNDIELTYKDGRLFIL